jgi:LysR family glycine cleavage system transcriptional activator
MQAVLAGQGVALMPTLVVEDEIANGRLVQPFPQPYPGQFGYYALTRRDRLEEHPVAAFRRWLIAEASKA